MNFWTICLKTRFAGHRNSTKEYAYQKQRQKQIGELLETNLTADEKDFVEEILFELGLAAERETEVVYQQGLQNGICR